MADLSKIRIRRAYVRITNTIIPGGAYVRSYPYHDGLVYEVPKYTMTLTGWDSTQRKWVAWEWPVIRFGIKRKTRTKHSYVVGLNAAQNHTLRWHESPSLGWVWKITGLYYIHVGPEGPKTTFKSDNGKPLYIASLGCIEPIGPDAWLEFKSCVAYACTGVWWKTWNDVDLVNKKISRSGRLKVAIDSAKTPKARLVHNLRK